MGLKLAGLCDQRGHAICSRALIWQDKKLELLLTVPTFAALLLVALAPRWRGAIRRAWQWFGWITSRNAIATMAGIALVVAIVATIPPILKWTHPPWIHDEIANLLAADTFLHGRLANPTPPLWESFQTNHELMVPSYASKFPPGQGLVLAAGTLLGSPRVGTIASLALGAALTAWMSRAVMSWRWATVCGLFAGFQPTIFLWSTNFWGGGVGMIGGALLAGCALRADAALRSGRALPWWIGVLAGVGMGIVANSRPFEGAITTMLFATWVGVSAARRSAWRTLLSPALFAALVLVPVFCWMGYYNYRVTGHALRMPYAEHARQYMATPIFWWQATPDPPPKITARHLANFYRMFEPKEYGHFVGSNFIPGLLSKFRDIAVDGIRPMLLALPLAGGLFVSMRRSRAARLALVAIAGLLVIHFSCTPWFRTHYLAVVAPLFMMFLTIGIRDSCKWLRRRFAFVRSLPMELPVSVALALVTIFFSLRMIQQLTARDDTLAHTRQKLQQAMESVAGKHLVLVYYTHGPQHIYEFVYNSADIESQRVVWAHEISQQQNTALSQHFKERSIWLLLVTEQETRMRPVVWRRTPGENQVIEPPVVLPEPQDAP